jgi:hypothetical protein
MKTITLTLALSFAALAQQPAAKTSAFRFCDVLTSGQNGFSDELAQVPKTWRLVSVVPAEKSGRYEETDLWYQDSTDGAVYRIELVTDSQTGSFEKQAHVNLGRALRIR